MFLFCIQGVLYGFKQIKVFKFVPRLILKQGIRKRQYFDPKLPMFAVANSFTAYLIYLQYGPQNKRISAD